MVEASVLLACTALHAQCHYYVLLYMHSVLIMYCFTCTVSLLCTALYAKVSLLCTALYAKCPYYAVLYAKCPYYVVLYMHSVLII